MRIDAQFGLRIAAILVVLSSACAAPAGADTGACRSVFAPTQAHDATKVTVSEQAYGTLLSNLRATLLGKLATVWRSEWKTKLSVERSNRYVYDLVQKFLTPGTRQTLLKDLDPKNEGFVREVHTRLYAMQKSGRLSEHDELVVRDPPAPPGTLDRTYTYYTRPLVAGRDGGKHQPRLRTYLRELVPDKMEPDVPVTGFDVKDQQVTVTKRAGRNFEIRTETALGEVVKMVDAEGLEKEFGSPATLTAPHGRDFKFEIKTALRDRISDDDYVLLGGDHMVEKLDVNLTFAQVRELFQPGGSPQARIDRIKQQLIAKNPAAKARIEAVFDVLTAGVAGHPDFLRIMGATVYSRTAFESPVGFQTTVDRAQSVVTGDMYAAGGLKTPAQSLLENQIKINGADDARHVELKVPVTLIDSALGMTYKDGPMELAKPTEAESRRVRDAMAVFYPYVTSSDHPGKFNYGLKQDD